VEVAAIARRKGDGLPLSRRKEFALSHSGLYKQFGRITFPLTCLLVAALCGDALQLAQYHPDNKNITHPLDFGMILLLVIWIRSIERRLQDARLPRWLFWPYFLVVFTGCLAAFALKLTDGSRTFALFVIVQLPTVLFPSRPEPLPDSRGGARVDVAYNRRVSRSRFLLRLFLLAVLFAALFQLQEETGPGPALWQMRVGLAIIGFMWIYIVEGRLLDAGLPRWASIPYCLVLPGICFLPVYFKVIDFPLALISFAALQILMVFFPSEVRLEELLHPKAGVKAAAGLTETQPAGWKAPVGNFEFAIHILLIAGVWAVLFLLRGDVGSGFKSWPWDIALDAVSVLVGALWIASVKGRLKNLGLMCWTTDFCLIVLAVSLPLFAFRVISLPLALAWFATVQIPAVFLRREFIPARLFSSDSDF
jgi:hypothetical protein